ncbi:MAG: SCO family protein, partial [Bacteroidia bacterium]
TSYIHEFMQKIYFLFIVSLSICLLGCNQTQKPRIFYPISVNEKGDTTFQTIANFEMLNQNGEKVTTQKFAGKVYVLDFFFASCLGICKKMTSEMGKVQAACKDLPGVQFVSVTVDVEGDSIPALKKYADSKKIDADKWDLLRPNNQTEATHIAQDIFHVSAFKDSTGSIQHDERFILVDKQGRIRGYYHVNEEEKLQQLVKDIKYLVEN